MKSEAVSSSCKGREEVQDTRTYTVADNVESLHMHQSFRAKHEVGEGVSSVP